ncbi:MAG: YicC/YloC family endoribonuclease [Hyphomicrobiales bacterium]|nr:YicC/YloC family endoribonuclease [Hyphomicrobiales bacterium]
MTLMSMTGFARSEDARGPLRWFWEVRSVNGRGLDLRLRLPAGFERLEVGLRQRLSGRLARGSVQASLQVQSDTPVSEARINMAVLKQMLATAEALRGRIEADPPRLDGLLALKGVVELVEPQQNEAETEACRAAIEASFDAALDALITMRTEEGARIGEVLSAQLDSMAKLADAATELPARKPAAVRERLTAQVQKLLEASDQLEPDRLHQEAVLLAAKSDIQEELDRLESHVAAARELLQTEGAVGRRLEFLAQEFNRETNTLCAKAADVSLSAIGLELKSLVDQFREQVQNIE